MGTSTGDKLCKICGDNPPAKGRTICERCKKQKQRDRFEIHEAKSVPGNNPKPLEEFEDAGLEHIVTLEAKIPHHALRVEVGAEVPKEAVRRALNNGKF